MDQKSKIDKLKNKISNLGGGRGPWVRKAVRQSAPQAVLDIGCAFGWNLGALSSEIDHLVGVDVNEEALSQARKQYPEVTFRQCSGANLPFGDETFDVAILSDVIELVEEKNRQDVIDEAYRVLTPHGRLVLTAPFDGATAWADPIDFKRRFSSLYRVYMDLSGYQPNNPIEIGHEHLSLQQINDLLQNRFGIEHIRFSGFFSPFISWILIIGKRTGALPERLCGLLGKLRAWEQGVPYPKPLAYKVRLVARKHAG